ncbi:MAG TPA: hypothetical protein VF533_21070 [Solirubrobacteraceae bacterium]
MRRALAAAALLLAGCGAPSGDLFAVERSGEGAGAKLSLVVSDGGSVRCNGRKAVALPARRLLEARELARSLEKQAALGLELPAGPREKTTFRYRAELADGTITWADSSRGVPPTFTRLAAFTRTVSRQVCNLAR